MSDKTTLKLAVVPTRQEIIDQISVIEPEYENYLESLPPEKKQRIVNSINRIQTGLHAVAPIMCLGPEKCPFIAKCPIPERDPKGAVEFGDIENYPMGRECILEKFYMQQKIIEYVEHLNVDPANPVEMSIVNELALIDLYKNRSLMVMSAGDKSGQGRDFMRVDILGFSEHGETAETAKLHPAVEMLDKLEKRRQNWLDKLMETRKAKADWAAKVGGAHNDSRILAEIEKLRTAITSLETDEPLKLEMSDEVLLDD
jgi:hypothetical protein